MDPHGTSALRRSEPPAEPGTGAATVGAPAAVSDAELFVGLYPSLRRFASTVSDRSTDPDDLVQEALARVLRGGPLQRLDEPLSYLRRVVLHLAIDEARRDRRAGERAPLVVQAGQHLDHYPSDLAFLDALSSGDKALLELTEIEGLTIADASKVLGIRAPAARARVMRARRRLRSAINEGEPT